MATLILSGEIAPVHQEVVLAIRSLAERHDIPSEMVVAAVVKSVVSESSPLGKLMQFVVDDAADQYIAEEFYQRHEGLLEFLAECGCNDSDVQFLSYVKTHPDIFVCKTPDCPGRIVGGCPKMFCEMCGKPYYVDIEDISREMCQRCVSFKVRECDERSRKRRFQIFAVRSLN